MHLQTRRAFLGAFFVGKPKHLRLAGIEFERIRNSRSPWRYLLIHGNELTARQVLHEHMQSHKGTAHLVTGLERNVKVHAGGDGEIDPNRLFSRLGADRSLRRLNPNWDEPMVNRELHRLDRERPALLKAVMPPRGGVLMAVHNNSQGYSVKEEIPISNEVSLPDEQNPHEFFLVTDPRDFERMKTSPYNVVLQNKPAGDDDGSLSRLMAARGVRYVNLEVGLGKVEKQREMLAWVANLLR